MVMTEVMLLVRMPFIRVVGMRSSAGLIDRTNEEEEEEEEEESNDDEKGRGGEFVEWENDEVDGKIKKEDMKIHPKKNVLMNALGTYPSLSIASKVFNEVPKNIISTLITYFIN